MTGRCVLGSSWPSGSTYSKRAVTGCSGVGGQKVHAARPVTSPATMAVAANGSIALPGWPRRRDGLHCSRTCAVECAIEREPGVADVANTLRSILVKAASEERRDARRESGWQQCPVRFASQHRGNDVGDFLSGKGAPAGQHLVDHGAERPDVTAFVDGFAPGLLRTHVGDRPQQHAVRRHHGG